VSLLSRVRRLERLFGTDDPPRLIVIYSGPHYLDNWIERQGDCVNLYVRIPDLRSDPMEHLTPDQQRRIRPEDKVVIIGMSDNGRDPDLQLSRPPWKRTSS
jgi:hypothetical protein